LYQHFEQVSQECICLVTGDMNATPDSEAVTIFGNNFGSVYPYTTMKFRTKLDERVSDYVFGKTDELDMIGYLDLPTDTDREVGCPSANYPSDHFAIGFEFDFVSKSS